MHVSMSAPRDGGNLLPVLLRAAEGTIQQQLREFEQDLRASLAARRQAEASDEALQSPEAKGGMGVRLQKFPEELRQSLAFLGPMPLQEAYGDALATTGEHGSPMRNPLPEAVHYEGGDARGHDAPSLANVGGSLIHASRSMLEDFIQQQLQLFEGQLRAEVSPSEVLTDQRCPLEAEDFVRQQLRAFEEQLRAEVYPIEEGTSTIDKTALGLDRPVLPTANDLIQEKVDEYETHLRAAAIAAHSPRRQQPRAPSPPARGGGGGQLPAAPADAVLWGGLAGSGSDMEAAKLHERKLREREAIEQRLQEMEDHRRAEAAVRIQSIQRGRVARSGAQRERQRLQEDKERMRLERDAQLREAALREEQHREERWLEQQRTKQAEREAACRKAQQLEEQRRSTAAIRIQSLQRSRSARLQVAAERQRLREEAEARRLERERAASEARRREMEREEREKEAARQREREAAVRRVQQLEEQRKAAAAVKIQSLQRGRAVRVQAQKERQQLRQQEEAKALEKRKERQEASAMEKRLERLEAERRALERQERLMATTRQREREAYARQLHRAGDAAHLEGGTAPREIPRGLQTAWGIADIMCSSACSCVFCSPDHGADRLEQLQLLVKLGENPQRCHQCDVGAVKLHALLRSLGRILAAMQGGLIWAPAGARGPPADWEIVAEVAEALGPVRCLDPQLEEMAAMPRPAR